MTTEQAEFEEFGTESSAQRLEREIKERVVEIRQRAGLIRMLKGRRRRSRPPPYPAPPIRRKPGGPDISRDIVEQLNYVASQLPGVCKNPHWGEVHEAVLRNAAREIRRLRATVYTSRGEPLGVRPKLQFVGPQISRPERAVWLAGLTEEERAADRRFGYPVARYELDAFRVRRDDGETPP